MDHAWLDSLSEDWVSQPGSERSPSASAPSLPKLGKPSAASSVVRPSASRLPRVGGGSSRPHATAVSVGSSDILSERSANEINIRSPHRTPSKLSQEVKAPERSRDTHRSASASSTGSVIQNTVNRKSASESPAKSKGQTPEWKRRLVHGDLPYGEQRDLFSSARTGLENIFQPPAPAPETIHEADEGDDARNDTWMPSSPPVPGSEDSYPGAYDDQSVAHEPQPGPPRPKTRAMRYRMTDDETAEPSDNSSVQFKAGWAVPEENSHLSVPRSDRSAEVDTELRKFSGQSVLRNEDFSPIAISPDKPGGEPAAHFGPLEVPPEELHQRLEKLRWNQMMLADEVNSKLDGVSATADQKSFNIENTEDYERAGGFINFRRGGRSADGSFRHRQLSPPPPPNPETSEILPEESLQASTPKQFPTTRGSILSRRGKSPLPPRAPHPSPEKQSNLQHGNAGSPLKLFGPYDTFTNQTLMRRISQFENQMSDSSRLSGLGGPSQSERDSAKHGATARSSNQSSAQFGAGDLDGYEFNDEFSRLSEEASAADDIPERPDDDRDSDGPLSSLKFDTSHVSSPPGDDDLVVLRSRQKPTVMASKDSSKLPTMSFTSAPDEPPLVDDDPEVLATPKRRENFLEGKRPRTSPSKDPTPKRRRTLHKSDVAYGVEDPESAFQSVQSSHQQMQSGISKKRRDARDGDRQQLANPTVLANRQILRPRTPTPSQRSSVQREQHPYAEADATEYGSPKSPPLQPTPHQASTHRSGAGVSGADRKPSIKTEDFMQEANKIMAMLRSRGGRQSGLASVDESESEIAVPQPTDMDGSLQESTKEPFSRPPSRDGRPLPRVPARQEDPELVARLKQYEERSDLDDFINSPTQDVTGPAKEAEGRVRGAVSGDSIRTGLEYDEVISDPPNIRISENPARRKASEDGSGGGGTTRDGFASHASSMSGSSTGRSIPTGSSRGSDSRKTIAPETVSHLIPDQVGSMMLDRERNIWIKRRQKAARSLKNVLPSEGSEDDPFADIPDLTVDATIELQNLRLLSAQKAAERRRDGDHATPAPSPSKLTNANAAIRPVLISPSKVFGAAAGTGESPIMSSTKSAKKTANVAEEADEVVEHEIGLHEDRVSHTTSPKKRSLTITFSSPIASIIQDVIADGMGTEDAGAGGESVGDISVTSLRLGRQAASIGKTSKRNALRGPTRQLSVSGRAFVPRPISRIEEREEESGLDHHQAASKSRELSVVGDQTDIDRIPPVANSRCTSLSFVVATPAQARVASNVDQGQIITQYVGTLSLSPLSDFTIHHDQTAGFEASYIHGDRRLVTGDGSKAVMAQTLRDLVDRLSEVEPFEPYWEDMDDIDLHDKRLSSLHKLDEFCPNIVTLDVSRNSLRNLGGLSSSIRNLKVVHNQLSELTSWAHLANLQYLDISNNSIKTLAGLKHLVHLRNVKADNCGLTSLDALKFHDGIQSLRARGNVIETIDFHGSKLHRLADLDLEGNLISSVANVEGLPLLSSLNLRNNRLKDFRLGDNRTALSLRMLDLSDNTLVSLDISPFPSLRLFYADRNSLVSLKGFSKTPRLDTVSLREQATSERLDISSLYHAYEIRKLYLSGNFLEAFDPPVDFLNLQLLELANCGLTSLPDELGQMMPNLRKVNLNFNALSSLNCLRHIPRLKKLLVAGNRLVNAYSAAETVGEFPHLAEVDLRDNSITQGFYAFAQTLTSADTKPALEPFALPDADVSKDRAYCSRLDLETGMRRRMYETVFGGACKKLKKLDGLPVNREIGQVRDAVWMALAAEGVWTVDTSTGADEEAGAPAEAEQSRWGAEDSFA